MMIVPAELGASMLRLYELTKDGCVSVHNDSWAYGECNHDPLTLESLPSYRTDGTWKETKEITT